jgi:hypothetical protein
MPIACESNASMAERVGEMLFWNSQMSAQEPGPGLDTRSNYSGVQDIERRLWREDYCDVARDE